MEPTPEERTLYVLAHIIVVDGKHYKAVPDFAMCTGCAGENSANFAVPTELCNKLSRKALSLMRRESGPCYKRIWKEVPDEQPRTNDSARGVQDR